MTSERVAPLGSRDDWLSEEETAIKLESGCHPSRVATSGHRAELSSLRN